MSMTWKVGDDPKLTTQLKCGPGKTKQSFAKQADINSIIAKYAKTGMLENVKSDPGVFADVASVGDFHGMMNKIAFAKEAFMKLPSGLRSRFSNDPGQLVAFISDTSNREEAVRLGLIEAKPSKGVPPVPAPKDPEPKAPAPKEATK